jgi:prepilin-type N-terminal cleavage/methylation domain-containing protein
MGYDGVGKSRNAKRGLVGFTLIELLAVIAIIGTLIALLIPAVQAAREAARRLQCGNHIKQLALAVTNHESALCSFPTGGWHKTWLGHPDRQFGSKQPGGWIYNVLPFLEQGALHDLGATGASTTIEDANAQRVAFPLEVFNCPTRRPCAANPVKLSVAFWLTDGTVTMAARCDYAMNAGDYLQWNASCPSSLEEGDSPGFYWGSMARQTGISHQRSQVRMSDIRDGTSQTFLIGEKCINRGHYTDGKDMGDCSSMYCGGDLELLRWTGIVGAVYSGTRTNCPRRDTPANVTEGSQMQWFGSAHAGAFNMAICDGSVRTIGYSIDGEVFRCLGNRKDGLLVDGSVF